MSEFQYMCSQAGIIYGVADAEVEGHLVQHYSTELTGEKKRFQIAALRKLVLNVFLHSKGFPAQFW